MSLTFEFHIHKRKLCLLFFFPNIGQFLKMLEKWEEYFKKILSIWENKPNIK